MDREKAINELTNRDLDIENVQKIYNLFKSDDEVVSQVAMNLSLKTSVYDIEMGKNETMIDLLTDISNAKNMDARWAVAKNPHTSIEILEKLSNDSVNLVRALVGTNPNTPSNILEKLFNDEKIVRDGLSGNQNTPAKLLNILADSNDKMARLRISENLSTSKETLERLTKDSDLDVSKSAKIHLEKKVSDEKKS